MSSALQHDEPAVPHDGGDLAQLLGRGDVVLLAGDRQHRLADLGEPVADVEARQRLAHLDVALVDGDVQGVEQGCSAVGLALEEVVGEPSLGLRAHEHGGSRGGHPTDAVGPGADVADAGARADQPGARHAIGVVEEEREPDRAADGHPRVGERRPGVAALFLDLGEQGEHALGELAHREPLFGDRPVVSVPGQVPGHDVEVAREVLGAGRPELRGAGTERRPEHEQRQLGAVGGTRQAHAGHGGNHASTPAARASGASMKASDAPR